MLATGGADKVVKLWDPSGTQTGTLRVSTHLPLHSTPPDLHLLRYT